MDNIAPPCRDGVRKDLEKGSRVIVRETGNTGYPATNAEYESVISLYDQYDVLLGAASEIDATVLQDEFSQVIKGAYSKTQKGGALKHIRSTVLSAASRCPICQIGPPKELDHYLPKEDFPHFGIYIRNLVPICHDCNNSKGAEVLLEGGQRFIHAYFDQLPDRHLCVEVRLQNNSLDTIYSTPDFEPGFEEIGARISYQVERLHLSSRWSDELITYMSAHDDALEIAFEARGELGVRQFLTRQAAKEERRFGLSCWRPVLLRELAENPAFCNGGFSTCL